MNTRGSTDVLSLLETAAEILCMRHAHQAQHTGAVLSLNGFCFAGIIFAVFVIPLTGFSGRAHPLAGGLRVGVLLDAAVAVAARRVARAQSGAHGLVAESEELRLRNRL